MRINIVHEDTLLNLSRRFPGLAHLADNRPPGHASWAWNNGDRIDANVLFLGKTGHGKSSLLNAISGGNHFATSDVEACTRDAASAEYVWPGQEVHHLSLVDMPGVGESLKRDEEYRVMYRDHCLKAGAVVWVLSADRRDYATDLDTLNWIFGNRLPDHVLFALNMIDRLPPVNRHSLTLTAPQQVNLEAKRLDCSRIFAVERGRVLPVSATVKLGLNELLAVVSHAVVYKSRH